MNVSTALLTLKTGKRVEAECSCFWGIVGSSGSSPNAQVRNRSDLREKIEDGILGLPPPEQLGEGGPNLHNFLLGDNTFALVP